MPVHSGKLAVGTAATQIPVSSVMPWKIDIHNDDNTDDLAVGQAGVTLSTGLTVNKLEHMTFEAGPLDRFFVVSSKTGHNVSYVAITQGE